MQLQDNSDQVKRDLFKTVLKGLTEGSLLIVGQTKTLVRKDTGALGDSFSHKIEEDGHEATSKIGSPLDYAVYNEFGTGEFAENGDGRKGGWYYKAPDGTIHFTKGMKPNPALRTAFRKNKKRIEDITGEKLSITFQGK